MRKTLRPAPRTRRSRKRIRLGALIAPSSTIQRSSPLLVTAEIRPTLARRWLGRTTGVSPRGGVAPAAHVVRAQAALVAPEDHSLLRLGPRRDRRVLPAQPAPYCGRVLLVGPPQRLLRRVAPARQVAAHGPHRHSDAEALPDQRLHRCPAPERKVQPQRIWHLLPDQGLDLRLLLCRQQAAVSWRRPAPLAFQPRRATLRKALADIKDPGRGQPDLGRDRRIGLPRLAQPNHLPPSLLLRLRRQAPHVYVLHCSGYLGTAGRFLKNTGAGSIAPCRTSCRPAGSGRRWRREFRCAAGSCPDGRAARRSACRRGAGGCH